MVNNNLTLLLLVMYYCDGKILGRKRFQKIICILKHKYDIPFTFEFIPYYYGPYSEYLSNSLDTLAGSGVLKEKEIVSDTFTQYMYEFTEYGKKMTENIIDSMNNKDSLLVKIRNATIELKDMETFTLVKISKQVFGM